MSFCFRIVFVFRMVCIVCIVSSRCFYAIWYIECVMKPIMATATAPAPEMRPNPARNGTMNRTIKADFDQSGDLSTLVSRLIVQQRWAYNMAVEKTLKDPAITGFDLYNKLTKWRKWEQVA